MTPEPGISVLELHSASSKGNISLKALLQGENTGTGAQVTSPLSFIYLFIPRMPPIDLRGQAVVLLPLCPW